MLCIISVLVQVFRLEVLRSTSSLRPVDKHTDRGSGTQQEHRFVQFHYSNDVLMMNFLPTRNL